MVKCKNWQKVIMKLKDDLVKLKGMRKPENSMIQVGIEHVESMIQLSFMLSTKSKYKPDLKPSSEEDLQLYIEKYKL